MIEALSQRYMTATLCENRAIQIYQLFVDTLNSIIVDYPQLKFEISKDSPYGKIHIYDSDKTELIYSCYLDKLTDETFDNKSRCCLRLNVWNTVRSSSEDWRLSEKDLEIKFKESILNTISKFYGLLKINKNLKVKKFNFAKELPKNDLLREIDVSIYNSLVRAYNYSEEKNYSNSSVENLIIKFIKFDQLVTDDIYYDNKLLLCKFIEKYSELDHNNLESILEEFPQFSEILTKNKITNENGEWSIGDGN